VNLLGFDTSTAASAACVLRDDGRAFEVEPPVEALQRRPAHAAELLPAVHRVLEESGLGFEDLDAIAVGRGPGSYTGLRIGIATARALAQACQAPLRPVSSLAALAAGVDAPLRLALIDAKRGEVFAALYEDGEARWPPFVARPEAVADRVRGEALTPPAVGDGSLRFAQVLEAAGVEVAPEGSRLHVVRALHLCRLAAEAPDAAPESVLPDYLRVPDAQPAR
jgi:tRNA threonylcarbamoyladenosine biosynthesis protein TsaB